MRSQHSQLLDVVHPIVFALPKRKEKKTDEEKEVVLEQEIKALYGEESFILYSKDPARYEQQFRALMDNFREWALNLLDKLVREIQVEARKSNEDETVTRSKIEDTRRRINEAIEQLSDQTVTRFFSNNNKKGDEYFTLKTDLEEIWFILTKQKEHFLTEKLLTFELLAEQFNVCGDGFYLHTQKTKSQLVIDTSLEGILSEQRKQIMDRFIQYVIDEKLAVHPSSGLPLGQGMKVHLARIFYDYAEEKGLKPPFKTKHKDEYSTADYIRLTRERLREQFLSNFLQNYTYQSILDNLLKYYTNEFREKEPHYNERNQYQLAFLKEMKDEQILPHHLYLSLKDDHVVYRVRSAAGTIFKNSLTRAEIIEAMGAERAELFFSALQSDQSEALNGFEDILNLTAKKKHTHPFQDPELKEGWISTNPKRNPKFQEFLETIKGLTVSIGCPEEIWLRFLETKGEEDSDNFYIRFNPDLFRQKYLKYCKDKNYDIHLLDDNTNVEQLFFFADFPDDSIVLQRKGGNVNAYLVKNGVAGDPISIQLDQKEQQHLEFPKTPGRKKFTYLEHEAIIDGIIAKMKIPPQSGFLFRSHIWREENLKPDLKDVSFVFFEEDPGMCWAECKGQVINWKNPPPHVQPHIVLATIFKEIKISREEKDEEKEQKRFIESILGNLVKDSLPDILKNTESVLEFFAKCKEIPLGDFLQCKVLENLQTFRTKEDFARKVEYFTSVIRNGHELGQIIANLSPGVTFENLPVIADTQFLNQVIRSDHDYIAFIKRIRDNAKLNKAHVAFKILEKSAIPVLMRLAEQGNLQSLDEILSSFPLFELTPDFVSKEENGETILLRALKHDQFVFFSRFLFWKLSSDAPVINELKPEQVTKIFDLLIAKGKLQLAEQLISFRKDFAIAPNTLEKLLEAESQPQQLTLFVAEKNIGNWHPKFLQITLEKHQFKTLEILLTHPGIFANAKKAASLYNSTDMTYMASVLQHLINNNHYLLASKILQLCPSLMAMLGKSEQDKITDYSFSYPELVAAIMEKATNEERVSLIQKAYQKDRLDIVLQLIEKFGKEFPPLHLESVARILDIPRDSDQLKKPIVQKIMAEIYRLSINKNHLAQAIDLLERVPGLDEKQLPITPQLANEFVLAAKENQLHRINYLLNCYPGFLQYVTAEQANIVLLSLLDRNHIKVCLAFAKLKPIELLAPLESNKNNILHYLASVDQSAIDLFKLLKISKTTGKALFSAKNSQGETALHLAMRMKNFTFIEYIMKHYSGFLSTDQCDMIAKFLIPLSDSKECPGEIRHAVLQKVLHHYVKKEKYSSASALLAAVRTLNKDHIDDTGMTLLHYLPKDMDLLRTLIKDSKSLSVENKQSQTFLLSACVSPDAAFRDDILNVCILQQPECLAQFSDAQLWKIISELSARCQFKYVYPILAKRDMTEYLKISNLTPEQKMLPLASLIKNYDKYPSLDLVKKLLDPSYTGGEGIAGILPDDPFRLAATHHCQDVLNYFLSQDNLLAKYNDEQLGLFFNLLLAHQPDAAVRLYEKKPTLSLVVTAPGYKANLYYLAQEEKPRQELIRTISDRCHSSHIGDVLFKAAEEQKFEFVIPLLKYKIDGLDDYHFSWVIHELITHDQFEPLIYVLENRINKLKNIHSYMIPSLFGHFIEANQFDRLIPIFDKQMNKIDELILWHYLEAAIKLDRIELAEQILRKRPHVPYAKKDVVDLDSIDKMFAVPHPSEAILDFTIRINWDSYKWRKMEEGHAYRIFTYALKTNHADILQYCIKYHFPQFDKKDDKENIAACIMLLTERKEFLIAKRCLESCFESKWKGESKGSYCYKQQYLENFLALYKPNKENQVAYRELIRSCIEQGVFLQDRLNAVLLAAKTNNMDFIELVAPTIPERRANRASVKASICEELICNGHYDSAKPFLHQDGITPRVIKYAFEDKSAPPEFQVLLCRNHKNLLSVAIASGLSDNIIQSIISNKNLLQEFKEDQLANAFMKLIEVRKFNQAELLLTNFPPGGNAILYTNENGKNALDLAIERQNIPMLSLLIDKTISALKNLRTGCDYIRLQTQIKLGFSLLLARGCPFADRLNKFNSLSFHDDELKPKVPFPKIVSPADIPFITKNLEKILTSDSKEPFMFTNPDHFQFLWKLKSIFVKEDKGSPVPDTKAYDTFVQDSFSLMLKSARTPEDILEFINAFEKPVNGLKARQLIPTFAYHQTSFFNRSPGEWEGEKVSFAWLTVLKQAKKQILLLAAERGEYPNHQIMQFLAKKVGSHGDVTKKPIFKTAMEAIAVKQAKKAKAKADENKGMATPAKR